MAEFVRRAVFSYSLASLYLLRSFNDFPFLRPSHETYWRQFPATPMYAALLLVPVLAVVIFAIVQWVAIWGERRLRARRLVDGLLVLSMLVPAAQIKHLLMEPNVSETTDAIVWSVVRLVIVSSAVVVFLHGKRGPYKVCVAIIMMVFPLYPVALIRAAMWKPVPAAPAAAQAKPGVLSQRVVWLVFDEADALALERIGTPGDLVLPEFDRLRGQSLSARNGYPAGPVTLLSIPSMLTGRRVSESRMRGAAELSLRWEGQKEWEIFGRQWTIFRGVRELGGNSGVTGWYHPYCRIFSSEVADCYFESNNSARDASEGGASLWKHMGNDLVVAANAFPLVGRTALLPPPLTEETSQSHAQRVENVVRRVAKQLTDTRLSFVLAHIPVPHLPVIYDRHTKAYSANGSYYDNLALADSVLGRLRRAMEESGVWDSTTVVVTADHSWRSPVGREQDPRVPFLIKFPKSMGAVYEYRAPVSTLVLSELTMQMLRGQIHSVDGAATWMKSKEIVIDKNKLLGKSVDFRNFEP
ncbi:MAG: sulfatase-like hydrolase/transferase [Bryobacteraceae bacterium]